MPTNNTTDAELDEAIALIKLSIEYADTHGGCPPAVKGVKRSGTAQAKAAILAWHNKALQEGVLDKLLTVNKRFSSKQFSTDTELDLCHRGKAYLEAELKALQERP